MANTVTVVPKDILNFWYSPTMAKHWFASTPAIDEDIRGKFIETWKLAESGQLADWMNTPEGCLALCIVFDQFPLNMFRGEAQSFSTEQQAVSITKHAVSQGFDKQIPKEQVCFLYMPLMHSENMQDQDESVRLFNEAGLVQNARFSLHHRGIVERFGRFPHRNVLLGRESSEDELIYLASDEAFTG